MAAQGGIGDVGIAPLPPRELQHLGEAVEEVALADTLAIQNRIHKGGLVVARLLHGLAGGSIAVATGLDEELFDESHHEEERRSRTPWIRALRRLFVAYNYGG